MSAQCLIVVNPARSSEGINTIGKCFKGQHNITMRANNWFGSNKLIRAGPDPHLDEDVADALPAGLAKAATFRPASK